jgi:hypothetical protein
VGEDAFEESEMHDGSPIVRRDKLVSRRMAALLSGTGILPIAIGIFVAFANDSSQKPLPAAALPFVVAALLTMGVAFGVMGIMFGVLRTVVTKKAVHVKYGLWGPTIPLEAIESVRVVDYDWTEYGGWGIRIGKDGSRAYVPRSGPCVQLVYKDGGTSKRVLVGGEDAAATVAAINEARTHTRVATEVRVSEHEPEAEALDEAEGETPGATRSAGEP